jgi:anti-sigma B factor antagonist
MEIAVTEDGVRTLRAALTGRFDAKGAEAVEGDFSGRIGKAGRNVLIDMSGVSFVGSLGIRLLISAARALSRAGHRLVLFGVQPAVAEVFATIALDELIPIAPDEAAALATLGA